MKKMMFAVTLLLASMAIGAQAQSVTQQRLHRDGLTGSLSATSVVTSANGVYGQYVLSLNLSASCSCTATLRWTDFQGNARSATVSAPANTTSNSDQATVSIHAQDGSNITVEASDPFGGTYSVWVDGFAFY